MLPGVQRDQTTPPGRRARAGLRRWAFHLAATLSLLMLVVVIVLWVRARTGRDMFELNGRHHGAGLYTARGMLRVTVYSFDDTYSTPTLFWSLGLDGDWVLESRRHGGLGIAFDHGPNAWNGHYYGVAVPPWLAIVLTAVLPATWLHHRRRRQRRLAAGCCRVCGYDLRMTPDRCPECGTAAEGVR